MTLLVVRPTSPARRCVACHDDLTRGEPRWTCAGCATSLHRDCLPGLRRCPTLGCRRPLRAGGPSPAGRALRRARSGAGSGRGLRALVVLAPGLVAALWPLLLALTSWTVEGVGDWLRLPQAISMALHPLGWLAVLLVPFFLGVGVLAPMAHDRGLPGRHDLRAGLSALVGLVVGGSALLVFLARLLFHT